MSASGDGLGRILTVALGLCLVCSVVVSTAAVVLKPAQQANKTLDMKRNILMAAGLLDPALSVEEQFEQVETRLVSLDEGRFVEGVDPASFDQREAAKDPAQSRAIPGDADPAKLVRREDKALVYLVRDQQGGLDKIILPIRGYGLWSTLHGFMALESDGNTVAGLGFYEHAETPGLGGEVDNPNWKAIWPGKQVYQGEQVAIQVLKAAVPAGSPDAQWQVDGLSGATLTTKGVDNLVRYWMGDQGFKPLLENLRGGEA
ncbi:MAG: Na(+)-translocating NADH-quinone reductase subunit C [Pseudomonadota bacterium]|nr:Na(+)-translocating NADH-quinone reductase subunit C [Pseudomonadota bacterium]